MAGYVEDRREDLSWLLAEHDRLVDEPPGEDRDAELAQIQRWLCRTTGMPSLSGAIDAARRLVRRDVTFIAPVKAPLPSSRSSNDDRSSTAQQGSRKGGGSSRPAGKRRRRPSSSSARTTGEGAPAPKLSDRSVNRALRLLAELDSLGSSHGRRRPKLTEKQQRDAERIRGEVLEVTGFSTVDGVRRAVSSYLAQRDGTRRYVPTKSYVETASERSLPRPKIVFGGSPGSGRT